MGRYQGYESYKKSGVEWLGDIPEHWQVKRLKNFAKICNGCDHKNVWDENGKYPIMGSGGVFGQSNKYLHSNPSVLLGRKGTINKPQFIDTPFWSVDTAYYTDIFPITNARFFYYLCLTIDFDLHKYGSAVPSMTQEKLNNIIFSAPPLDEQESIACFLDRKTSQIDTLIAKKAALLEKLDEKRTALISHAVTKGLDSSVPMKDSGVEWLGDIPEHWQIIRLKHLAEKITDGEHISPKNIDEGIPLLSAKDIRERYIRFDDASYVSEQDAQKFWNRCKPERGDILIVSRGATVGRIGFVETNNNFCLMGSVILIKLKNTVCPAFIYFASNQDYVQKKIIQVSDASAQQAIYLIDVKETNFLLPPDEEQEKIATFLNQKIAEIDRQKAKIKEAIELLKEYRTALITNAVTGKIDVRQVARV